MDKNGNKENIHDERYYMKTNGTLEFAKEALQHFLEDAMETYPELKKEFFGEKQ